MHALSIKKQSNVLDVSFLQDIFITKFSHILLCHARCTQVHFRLSLSSKQSVTLASEAARSLSSQKMSKVIKHNVKNLHTDLRIDITKPMCTVLTRDAIMHVIKIWHPSLRTRTRRHRREH